MIIYTVVTGDTLSSIAERFNTTVSRIAADNALDPTLPLLVGQSLVILYPQTVYTAKEGDTVLSIAQMFGTTAVKIWQNNPILRGKHNLFPGQTVVISYGEPLFGEKTVHGYAYTYIEDDLLSRTLPYLTYLSVFPYGINENGDIISPVGDTRLIDRAKEYNTVPLLTLTSLTPQGVFSSELVNSVLSDETLRNTVIRNTANAVFSKGLGGVDVDFEFIDPSLAQSYTAFIEELKNALGDGYTVLVDLAPKTYAAQPGLLYEAHSYPSLGAAADKVFLMTYEWGYMFGPPLAISPVENVRAVIEYAVTEIPSDKILMGIPSYGYDWPLPYIPRSTRAMTISPDEALQLAREKGAEILYDSLSASPYFYYTENGVEHIVWFQDARSADALSSLAEEYFLDGMGIWNIMRWFPQLWPVLISKFSIRKVI